MRVDRISDQVFVLMSARYAQVTSTVILTTEGAIVVDTLPFPSETKQILTFVSEKLGSPDVRYVINTHHHADHVNGTSLFPMAEVISQDRCRELLATHGRSRLASARRNVPELAGVTLRLPDMTFAEQMQIEMGGVHLNLSHTPGHSTDGLSVYIVGEKALVAGDAMMPVPHIVGGSIDQLDRSLAAFKELAPGFVVQGHGTVLLRGEAMEMIDQSRAYLQTITSRVSDVVRRGDPATSLEKIDIESCGLSRIPLDGLVSRLHIDNLMALYRHMTSVPK